MSRLFVYGTLRRGECNAHLMAGQQFVGEARTAPGFALFDLGWHPAMVRGGSGTVAGEVWDVDAPALLELDRLEQHPTWYQRITIDLADGSTVETYVMPPAGVAGRPPIASGDWKRR